MLAMLTNNSTGTIFKFYSPASSPCLRIQNHFLSTPCDDHRGIATVDDATSAAWESILKGNRRPSTVANCHNERLVHLIMIMSYQRCTISMGLQVSRHTDSEAFHCILTRMSALYAILQAKQKYRSLSKFKYSEGMNVLRRLQLHSLSGYG